MYLEAKKELEEVSKDEVLTGEKLQEKENLLKLALNKDEIDYQDQDAEYKELDDKYSKLRSKMSTLEWTIQRTENYDPLKSQFEFPKIETEVIMQSCLSLALKFTPESQDIIDALKQAGAKMEHDPNFYDD